MLVQIELFSLHSHFDVEIEPSAHGLVEDQGGGLGVGEVDWFEFCGAVLDDHVGIKLGFADDALAIHPDLF